MPLVYPIFNGGGNSVSGFPGVVLVGRRNKFTQGVGVQFEQTYRGPFQMVSNLGDLQRSVGWTVEFTSKNSPLVDLVATITTTPGGNPNSDFQDSWELARNSVQKELLESDHPLISTLDATNLAELKKYMANPDLFVTDNGFSAVVAGTGPSYDAATYLWDLFQSGVKNVEVRQPILRLTRTISLLYTSSTSLNNVDKVLTTSTMMADSGVPSDYVIDLGILFDNLTSRVALKSDGSQARADSLVLKFGWLKDVTALSRYGSQRQTIVSEWKLGLYDTKLYGDPI